MGEKFWIQDFETDRFLVQESPEGGYEAKALGQAIFTEADTLDELRLMVKDAVMCHFDERERPRVVRLHNVDRIRR